MNKRYIIGFLALTLLFACVPKIDIFQPTAGTADFTTYVSLGNSLTAGYADGALYRQGQIFSFPNILAGQLAKVGMQGEFAQPLMPEGDGVGIGTGGTLNTELVLGISANCLGAQGLTPLPANPDATQGALAVALNTPVFASQGPFNNFGVPGAKVAHLLAPGYGNAANLPNANPYYIRFASSTTTSVVADAVAQNPTFFTLWIGNNDVLGYATSGGIGDVITPTNDFTTYMTALVQTLTANGANGAIANIPDVTSIPFFTTVPYNGLVLTEQTQVDALNVAYAALGITFSLGQNAFIIADAGAPGGLRQIQEGELVLLTVPQDEIRCEGLGSQTPIPDQYVLTATEIAQLSAAIAGYNQAIEDLADAYDLALVDINAQLDALQTGLIYDGVGMNTTFVTGGTFSLDGIHLNPRGYAMVANLFIDAINDQYNANIPKVNVVDYPGVEFP